MTNDLEVTVRLIIIFYVASTIWIDVGTILIAVFTHKTFAEFGRQNRAKRLINHGVMLVAYAWTFFFIGALLQNDALPFDDNIGIVLWLYGILLKDISTPLQVAGWFYFWRAMASVFVRNREPFA